MPRHHSKTTSNTASKLNYLKEQLGFDKSHAVPFKGIKAGCSKCEAMNINGTPTHETGCPNQTFECKGCSNRVSRRGAYCTDCM